MSSSRIHARLAWTLNRDDGRSGAVGVEPRGGRGGLAATRLALSGVSCRDLRGSKAGWASGGKRISGLPLIPAWYAVCLARVVRLRASCLQGSTEDCAAFCHFWLGSTEGDEGEEASIIRRAFHPLSPRPPPHTQTTSAAIQLILWAAMGERGQGGGPLLIILFRVSVDRCEPSRMTFFSVKPIWCLCVRRCEKADHGSVRWSDSGILVAAARESAFNSKWHFNIFIIIVAIWLYSPSFFASSLERKKYLTAERNTTTQKQLKNALNVCSLSSEPNHWVTESL